MRKTKEIFLIVSILKLSSPYVSAQWSGLGDSLVSHYGITDFQEWNSKLYVIGAYSVHTDTVCGIASYDGVNFSYPMAPGYSAETAVVFNNNFYAGGWGPVGECHPPTMAGTLNIAKWDGSNWYSVGGGGPGGIYDVKAMAVYKGELYVGGVFYSMGGISVKKIARWDGTQWKDVGGGFPGQSEIDCMVVYDGELYVGGQIGIPNNPNSQYYNLMRWNGTQWDSVGGKFGPNFVTSLCVDTTNNFLYIGGGITYAGSIPVWSVAQWDGFNLSSPGGLGITRGAKTMCMYHNELYVGGTNFSDTNLVKYDGIKWTQIKPSPQYSTYSSSNILSLAEYNGSLYVGGDFTHIDTLRASSVAKWNSKLDTTCKFLQPIIESMHSLISPNLVADTFYYTDSVAVQFYNNIASASSWIWTFGDGNTGVGQTPMHYYHAQGTYTVTLIVNYPFGPEGPCIDTVYSYVVIINTTSVNELNNNLKFKIYPNPAKAEININVEGGENKEYIAKIYNNSGAKITELKFSKQSKISTSSFSKGIYEVQVCDSSGKNCHTEKVVLQ